MPKCATCGSNVVVLDSEQTAKILLWLREKYGKWTFDLTPAEATAVLVWLQSAP